MERILKNGSMTAKEKARIEAIFERHINKGQVKYLKAGRLDVLETQRQGISGSLTRSPAR